MLQFQLLFLNFLAYPCTEVENKALRQSVVSAHMYRKQQLEMEGEVMVEKNPLDLQCLHRVLSLPAVNAAVSYAADVYGKAKVSLTLLILLLVTFECMSAEFFNYY